MMAVKKKTLTLMYAIIAILSLLIIIACYFVELQLKKPGDQNSLLEYIKGILFGIFAGALTGFATAFYDYRQQVFSDLYFYIKQTRDCVNLVRNCGLSRYFQSCSFQIIQYQDSVSSIFAIRKLRYNNEKIINLLTEIKNDFQKAYSECNNLEKEYNSLLLIQEQLKETTEKLIEVYGSKTSKDNFEEIIAEKRKDIDNLNKIIKLDEEKLEVLWKKIDLLLDNIFDKSQKLYEYVNCSRKIYYI